MWRHGDGGKRALLMIECVCERESREGGREGGREGEGGRERERARA